MPFFFPQSWTTINAQHLAYASVEFEPDTTRHCFEPLSILPDFEDKVTISGLGEFPKFECMWHQRPILTPTGFLLQTVKNLQLIDRAACRKPIFKLPAINLRDIVF